MRKAIVKIHNNRAGVFVEVDKSNYIFQYDEEYAGPHISLTMPLKKEPYSFDAFPPFFDGFLPEGIQLEGLLRIHKIDSQDYFRQLTTIGADMVGAVTVEPAADE